MAILASLIHHQLASSGQPTSSLIPIKTGIGTGSLEMSAQPNILRIFHLQETPASFHPGADEIVKLETNLDDVRGEILGNVVEVLMKRGALDVFIQSTLTKKNRPGHLITVLAKSEDSITLADVLMRETGTLGVRFHDYKRITLERVIEKREIMIDDKYFTIRVKIAKNAQGEVMTQKVEFEDLKKIAAELSLSVREVEIKIKI